MRILALAILAIGAASAAAPAQAQTYDPTIRFACMFMAGAAITNVPITPCLNATRRPWGARRNA